MSETSRPNLCGTCTLCCKLLGVEDPTLHKPVGQWCSHCRIGQGCSIYANRPRDCQTYTCVWLTWTEQGNPKPVAALRPDRCKVVIDAELDGVTHNVRVDPSRRDAWKAPVVQTAISALLAIGPVYLVNGEERKRIVSVG